VNQEKTINRIALMVADRYGTHSLERRLTMRNLPENTGEVVSRILLNAAMSSHPFWIGDKVVLTEEGHRMAAIHDRDNETDSGSRLWGVLTVIGGGPAAVLVVNQDDEDEWIATHYLEKVKP
jgi:hypothetical protein